MSKKSLSDNLAEILNIPKNDKREFDPELFLLHFQKAILDSHKEMALTVDAIKEYRQAKSEEPTKMWSELLEMKSSMVELLNMNKVLVEAVKNKKIEKVEVEHVREIPPSKIKLDIRQDQKQINESRSWVMKLIGIVKEPIDTLVGGLMAEIRRSREAENAIAVRLVLANGQDFYTAWFSGGGGGGTTISTSAIEALLTSIRDNTDGLEGFTDGIEASLTALQGYVDGLEGLLTTLNASTDQLEGFTDGLETLITTLNGYVDGLEGFVDGIETALGTSADAASATGSIHAKLRTIASIDLGAGNASATTTRVVVVTDQAALPVKGEVAHDGSGSSANPVPGGVYAIGHGSAPTSVAAGDISRWHANRDGVPFVMGGHPNVERLTGKYTSAQTDTVLKTVNTGQKFVVTEVSIFDDNANTVDTQALLEFDDTADVRITEHPGIAKGSGIVEGNGGGIIATGGDGQDVLFTCEVPTGGNINVQVSGYIIPS